VNWDDLRFVLAVGRAGTLAAAARDLKVDATTVGRRLIAVEEALGTRLFERTADGLTPTETGETTLARAAEMEEQALALARQVSGKDARPEGTLRLTAIDLFFDAFLIPRLGPFVERYPGIELSLVSDVRLFDLSRREADVGIRAFKPRHPDLVGRRLGTQAIGVYASPAYLAARGPLDGDGQVIVGFPAEFADSDEARTLERLLPRARIGYRPNTGGHMVALARAGLGVALLECVAGDAEPGLARAVPEPVMSQELWAVVHADMKRNARTRAMIDYLAELVSANADVLDGRRRI
jgi:DNA-binding transcriptional LysR family regulator